MAVRSPEIREIPTHRNKSNAHSWLGKIIMKSGVGAAVFALGATIGAATFSKSESKPASPTRAEITKALNSDEHVAQDVQIEDGYQIPFSGVENAVAITNPIKLGNETYGYVDPSTQSGKVKIGTVHYSGELKPLVYGGYSQENPHLVTTPISLVYSDYPPANGGNEDKYYSVVMGDRSGNTQDLLVYPPGYSTLSQQQTYTAQELGQIAAASVGEISYSGK